jgi:hypothetical protein
MAQSCFAQVGTTHSRNGGWSFRTVESRREGGNPLKHFLVLVVRSMQKKRNNPQANSSEFAYVRIALELILEISFNTIIALAFSIFR